MALDAKNPQLLHVRSIANGIGDPLARATRIYLEEPSYCTFDKRNVEFEVKRSIADWFGVSYRSIAFTGSAHLGFSPVKMTEFKVGYSDLDVAIISPDLYQRYFTAAISVTRAFSDLGPYTRRGGDAAAERLKEYIWKRGMIALWNMPFCEMILKDEEFLSKLSEENSRIFSGVSVAIYINEYSFCWKQDSAIRKILRTV